MCETAAFDFRQRAPGKSHSTAPQPLHRKQPLHTRGSGTRLTYPHLKLRRFQAVQAISCILSENFVLKAQLKIGLDSRGQFRSGKTARLDGNFHLPASKEDRQIYNTHEVIVVACEANTHCAKKKRKFLWRPSANRQDPDKSKHNTHEEYDKAKRNCVTEQRCLGRYLHRQQPSLRERASAE